MKQKLINFIIQFNEQSVIKILLVITATIFIANLINLVFKLINHQDPTYTLLLGLLWFYIFLNQHGQYEKAKLREALIELNTEASKLLQFILFIKDANSHGITIQQLEKKGILKMEILPIPSPDLSKEDQEAVEEIIRRKLEKKEKLAN